MKNKILTLSIFFSIFFTSNSIARMTLDATEQVEWHSKEQKVVATGNAVATKDDMKITADSITGHYRKESGKTNIYKVRATKNVKITSSQTNASGEVLDYNVDKDELILSGAKAKISTADATIESDKGIKFFPSKNHAIAMGKVVAIEKDNTIYADNMDAYFKNNKDNNLEIHEIIISGNIKIVSPDATVTADRGIYTPSQNKIELFDNVIINQNKNILKGDYAETNLLTGISKLIANKSGKGRVSGVFIEEEKNSN